MTAPERPEDENAPAASGALEAVEEYLLHERPTLNQIEVAERAGLPLDAARELWHLLGFAHLDDEVRGFTPMDVRALTLTKDLIDLGILSQEHQNGLVRTWGRSFARLAEWQVGLLADLAAETGSDPTETLLSLADEVVPKVEELQTFVWRRHMLSVTSRLLAVQDAGSAASMQAVCFVDIVGYTSRSRTLSDRELVSWLEDFEGAALDTVLEHDGRIIKNIGDELLVVTDSPDAAAEIGLALTRRGADPEDPFPEVRAGIAYGEVVTRLGDVFGPVVNVAARLTSVARPCTVLVDKGMYAALTGRGAEDDDGPADRPESAEDQESPYRLKRVRRISVKGYSRLRAWALERR